jgi:hypothetical protein
VRFKTWVTMRMAAANDGLKNGAWLLTYAPNSFQVLVATALVIEMFSRELLPGS